jgi:serine protease Do
MLNELQMSPSGRRITAAGFFATVMLVAGAVLATPKMVQAEVALPSFADLIEEVSPAVVNIQTTGEREVRGQQPFQFRFPDGSPFDEYFRRFFDQPFGEMQPRSRRFSAQGSGFIVDPSGFIVTNNHVVDEAGEITVILHDGTHYTAEVQGSDPQTDLAVLKIEADEPLPFVSFGDSDAARVGDWVLAIGNPFGLGHTATSGIISARGRDIRQGPFDDFIQIDAPINRGNSGGPLFNISGEVIGVNTAIFSPTGGNVGIGFAIPSAMARSIVDQLQVGGEVVRGWLGVHIQEVTDDIAASLGIEARGALVAQVMPGTPAAAAGVEAGDVITSFAARRVDRMRDLPRLVAETRPDSAVEIEVWRSGELVTLEATIGQMPRDDAQAQAPTPEQEAEPARLGLTLAPLDAEMRARLGLDSDATGAVVTQVQPDGPAARQGVEPGDLITRVGQVPVESPDDVARLVQQAADAGRDRVLLLIVRDGSPRFVPVELG